MIRRAGALLLASLAIGVITPRDAHAWVRTLTCFPDDAGPFACEGDEIPLPLYWPTRKPVPYWFNERGTAAFLFDPGVWGFVAQSFRTWDEVTCSALRLQYAGETDETHIGFDRARGTSGNRNIVIFIDENWRHTTWAIALTSVTYDVKTGRIYDADIEVNTADHPWGVVGLTQNAANAFDLESALTHEVGHFVGLDHANLDPDSFVASEADPSPQSATMFASVSRGESEKRTLSDDDIAGLCAVYPPVEEQPRKWFDCSAAPAPATSAPTLAALLALLIRRRRRGG